MEATIFCVTIGLIMAVVLVAIGMCIANVNTRSDEGSDKDPSKDVRNADVCDNAVSSRGSDLLDSSVGDVHREESRRLPVGYLEKVDGEVLATFLRCYMNTGVHLSPVEKDYFKEIMYRLDPW